MVGAGVEAKAASGTWWSAVITKVYPEGSFDVDVQDGQGTKWPRMAKQHIRRVSGGGSRTGSPPSDTEYCSYTSMDATTSYDHELQEIIYDFKDGRRYVVPGHTYEEALAGGYIDAEDEFGEAGMIYAVDPDGGGDSAVGYSYEEAVIAGNQDDGQGW